MTVSYEYWDDRKEPNNAVVAGGGGGKDDRKQNTLAPWWISTIPVTRRCRNELDWRDDWAPDARRAHSWTAGFVRADAGALTLRGARKTTSNIPRYVIFHYLTTQGNVKYSAVCKISLLPRFREFFRDFTKRESDMRFSPVDDTGDWPLLSNISAKLRKNSKWPPWYTHGATDSWKKPEIENLLSDSL